MALRDQPYLPLYVQDYLTDEKLNNCSPFSQGIYIKIMCLFHKCDPYGGILLEQKDKQTENICLNFAKKLSKQLPFDSGDIYTAIQELLDEKVLRINENFLFQKRMVKDNSISNKRSEVGSKGGKKTQSKVKQFAKAKIEANTEIEYEDEIKDGKEKGVQGEKPEQLFGNHGTMYTEEQSSDLEHEIENNFSQHESLVTTALDTYKLTIGTPDVIKFIPAFIKHLKDTSQFPLTDKEAKKYFGNWFKLKLKDHVNGNNKNRVKSNSRISDDYRRKLADDLQTGIHQATAAQS